jgi:hypothetical protein
VDEPRATIERYKTDNRGWHVVDGLCELLGTSGANNIRSILIQDIPPCFKQVLTGLIPYDFELRDDFAGVESVRGVPPGAVAHLDEVFHPRSSSWITNGIWNTISRCWTIDPLLRPSATVFLDFLRQLEGRQESWIPINVEDLSGKVKQLGPEHSKIGPGYAGINRYFNIWMWAHENVHDLIND